MRKVEGMNGVWSETEMEGRREKLGERKKEL